MTRDIVGRQNELAVFGEKLKSVSAEFIIVYGRRRVGKTYLINKFFSQQSGVYFEQTGINEGTLQEQLNVFAIQLSKSFYKGIPLVAPKSWMEAFQRLTESIEDAPKNKRITLFFDELPWLASRKSGFLKALEYYWNTNWTYRKKLILIVCGSAASWMIENIIYAKGGFHNRITQKIPLKPFTIKETEAYLKYLGVKYNRQQILQIYMTTGGIPHYLNLLQKGISAVQNINSLCFKENAPLVKEFDILFHSLYEDPDLYIDIIRTISQKSNGMSRDELTEKINRSSGGRLSTQLRSLEEAGFIISYLPIGHQKNGMNYRVIDEYTLFYLTWIEPILKKTIGMSSSSNYWESIHKKPSWNTWSGYAFESFCFKHIEAIRRSLGLENIITYCSSWRHRATKKSKITEGAQIDLVFDREDDCITLCEIKFSDKPYLLTSSYVSDLEKKERIFNAVLKNKKQIFWSLITNNGAVQNENLSTKIDHIISLDDFFV